MVAPTTVASVAMTLIHHSDVAIASMMPQEEQIKHMFLMRKSNL
jgi:predicted Na+-dependent transporter